LVYSLGEVKIVNGEDGAEVPVVCADQGRRATDWKPPRSRDGEVLS